VLVGALTRGGDGDGLDGAHTGRPSLAFRPAHEGRFGDQTEVLSGAREAEADAGWIAGRSGLEDVRMMEVQEGGGGGGSGRRARRSV
jgi:hypothetical protein